jgi:hypothetical protein
MHLLTLDLYEELILLATYSKRIFYSISILYEPGPGVLYIERYINRGKDEQKLGTFAFLNRLETIECSKDCLTLYDPGAGKSFFFY